MTCGKGMQFLMKCDGTMVRGNTLVIRNTTTTVAEKYVLVGDLAGQIVVEDMEDFAEPAITPKSAHRYAPTDRDSPLAVLVPAPIPTLSPGLAVTLTTNPTSPS